MFGKATADRKFGSLNVVFNYKSGPKQIKLCWFIVTQISF